MSIANRPLTGADFGLFFQELWGREPYDWQQRLAEQVLQSGRRRVAGGDCFADCRRQDGVR